MMRPSQSGSGSVSDVVSSRWPAATERTKKTPTVVSTIGTRKPGREEHVEVAGALLAAQRQQHEAPAGPPAQADRLPVDRAVGAAPTASVGARRSARRVRLRDLHLGRQELGGVELLERLERRVGVEQAVAVLLGPPRLPCGGLAPANSAFSTWSGVLAPAAKSSAATPATCGVAMLVPWYAGVDGLASESCGSMVFWRMPRLVALRLVAARRRDVQLLAPRRVRRLLARRARPRATATEPGYAAGYSTHAAPAVAGRADHHGALLARVVHRVLHHRASARRRPATC